jgi:PAS domain S-box-containing protein
MDQLRTPGAFGPNEGDEAKPAEADALLRRLLESSLQGLFVCSGNERLVEANDAFLRICGRSRDELRRGDLEWSALVAPCNLRTYEQARERLHATGELAPFELLFSGTGGVAVPTLVSGTRLPQGAAIFVHDLSEPKRRATALRQTERRLALLLEASHGALFSVAADRTLSFTSGGEHIGLSHGASVGSSIDEALRERPALLALIGRALAGEAADARITEGGLSLDVKVRPLPLQPDAPPGAPAEGVAAVALDVTELVKASEERTRRERHFGQLQRLESVGLLAGGLAFEFNNLLAGVLGNLSSVLQSEPPHPHADALKDALASAQRASDLTRQLLSTARQSQGEARNVDLSTVVRELGPLLEAGTPRRARIAFDLGAALPAVRAHLDPLRQTLLSLVASAIDATATKGGLVRISTGLAEVAPGAGEMAGGDRLEPGWYVQLTVADDGPPLDAGAQQRLFEPFFDGLSGGRSLGLAAVLGHVRAVRGGVRLRSSEEGTRVEVLLPASDEPDPQQPGLSPPPPSASRTVLVVDDDAVVRRAAVRIVESMGLKAREAKNGDEAVKILTDDPSPVGLVLLDFAMPGMNGDQTLRALRALRPGVRVLLCSGYTEEDATWRVEKGELTGFVPKPFTAKDLQRAVRYALEGDPNLTPPIGVKKLRL